ncbi:hypothetical protein [Halocola ammonii]
MITYNAIAFRTLFVLAGLLVFSFTTHSQTLEDLLRKVDSTKNSVMDQFEQGPESNEENLPDIAYQPDKLLWQTVYLPYVKFEIPRQSNYDLNFRYSSMITFHSGLGDSPTNALCEIGVMSKKEYNEDYLPRTLSRNCGACETQPLPADLHSELAARNGKYIEYVRPRDYMSVTAFGEINQDSIFLVTVMSRTSDNFKQTTPAILKYVLSKVEILDSYGPSGKKLKMEREIDTQTATLSQPVVFDEKSETFAAIDGDGDLYVAAVSGKDTFIELFPGGDLSNPASLSKMMENGRLRDLIATRQGFAGLFIEDVADGQLMFLIHFDKNGNQLFKTQLVEKAKIENVGDMAIWDGYDSHKLAQIGDRFVALISVQKRWESGFGNTIYNPNSACSGNGIHQADALITLDASGSIEYSAQSQANSSGSSGYSMSAGSSGNSSTGSQTIEQSLKYGNWWGASHSFTKDLVIRNDHALKMTVNDGFPLIGMATSMNDLNYDQKFESTYYDPYYDNLDARRFNRMIDCKSEAGANYVDGLMAGNLHVDAEQWYATYAKASDRNGKEIFPKPVGGIYDANYHTKDVYFNDRNLTNTPDLLETNVKSIPLGDYFLINWNVFPENPEEGQPQDQLVIVDQNGNAMSEVADISTDFFSNKSAQRNRGYFLYHNRLPVYHGSDMVKLDDYTALWARVLPGTGEVEIVTIQLPAELR